MVSRAGFEEAALSRILDGIDGMVDAASSMMGTPPGARTYTTDEQLTEWNFSPIADPAQRVEAMLTLKMQGRTDEEITDAIYPNRRRLITTGRPRIDEQVKFAREMNALMRKKEAERMGQMPPVAGATAPVSTPATAPNAALTAPATAPMSPATTPPTAPTAPAAPAQPSMLDMPAMPMMGGA